MNRAAHEPFRWFVPLVDDPARNPSLTFARWLAKGNDAHEFTGVRLVKRGHTPPPANSGPDDSILHGIVNVHAEALGLASPASSTSSQTSQTGQALGDGACPSPRSEDFDGVILSRLIGPEGRPLIDESPLVRHLVSKRGKPVIIVPEDLHELGVSTGPVLVAAADDAHAELTDFAGRIATTRNLRTLLLRVVNFSTDRALQGRFEELVAKREAEEIERLAKFVQGSELHAAPRRILHGDLSYCIQMAARRADASLVVTGTDHEAALARLKQPSPAVALARYASTPIALVPRRRHVRASSDAA